MTVTDNTHTQDFHTVSIPENPVRHFPHVFFVSKQGSLCNAEQLGELEQFTLPRMEATWNLKNKKENQKKERLEIRKRQGVFVKIGINMLNMLKKNLTLFTLWNARSTFPAKKADCKPFLR